MRQHCECDLSVKKRQLTTVRFIVNAVAVENKGPMWSVDADGHRPVFEQRQLEGVCIARRDVSVALDPSEKIGLVHVAKAILWKTRKQVAQGRSLRFTQHRDDTQEKDDRKEEVWWGLDGEVFQLLHGSTNR